MTPNMRQHVGKRVGSLLLALLVTLVLPLSSALAAGPSCTVNSAGGADYTTIHDAVNDTGCGTITISPGVYTENLVLVRDLTLQGAGGGQTTIDGGENGPVVNVNYRAHITLIGLTLTHGSAAYGAGIYTEGSVMLQNSTVSANTATTAAGGGIFNNNGTVTLRNSTVSANSTTTGAGGGIWNANGLMTLQNSTVSANIGGGIGLYSGTVTLQGSIVAKQTSGPDCENLYGTLTSQGYNLDSSLSCALTQPTDKPGTDPLLGPLQDNGGANQTMGLLAGSPAIDAIPVAACAVTTDQRGITRPQGSACDSGAYEATPTVPPIVNVSFTPNGQNGWFTTDPATGNVTAAGLASITGIMCDGATVSNLTGLGTARASATLIVAGEGSHAIACSATDSAGQSGDADGSQNTATVKIDTTAPTLNPVVSPNPVPLHGSATASPNASDATSGVASQSCGSVDTGSVGTKIVQCTATDTAGNSSSASVNYTVVAAFPTTSVLDTFNRANGGVGSNWSGLTGTNFYRITNNQLDIQAGGPLVWQPTVFGTTQEAFVTLSTLDTGSLAQGVLLKVQPGSIPQAGAIAVSYNALAKAVQISTLRVGARSWTLYANGATSFAKGDQLGARALASGAMQIYKNGTLVLTVPLSAADQAFFDGKGGQIGIWTVAAPNAFFDDFGGGTTTP